MPDILIRGMEMPTAHRIETRIFKNGFVAYYDVYGRYIGQAQAIPLPEGHGKLADLDAIVKRFDEIEADFDKKEFYQGACWFHVIAELLKKAPTIVPAEGGGEDGN